MIGLLIIAKRGGYSVIVNLFSLPQQPGAFSVEAFGGRTYYHSGDSEAVKKTLRAAYKASRNQ